ncbi:MAG: hypothetical protein A2498_07165 [Lentisphaerae bacterium RIFOXYC12_FULL_60_16]|nr:MAG: hypothetical protein A2498_07165 [Lentisphaerae bacterium RIFOXYC12_FULL_60_16]OGV69360.1 MAG: hypothetical protein A2269_02685 [Lentisphaerae bacterium RIFOXYA12_FULL_60_10]
MKAHDIQLRELVEFGEGRIDLEGRRLVLHSLNAFAQFRKDLVDMVGMDQARRILTRFGNFSGRADAAAMKRIYQWDSWDEWLKAGPRMHTIQGVTRTHIKQCQANPETGNFNMEVVWHESGEADEHLLEIGRADSPICWMLVGYASGYASFCMGQDIFFVETQCRGCGDAVCTATGKDRASWGEALNPYLPYFQADDIHGKVMILTEELKLKTRELARQRNRLNRLERAATALPAEVNSDRFARVLNLAARAAPFDSSILITGESGTGKEVLARYIHRLSNRASGPFMVVNCAALPETLLESELFGHKAGAFTGAAGNRAGLFEQADHGTVFLDEIGEVTAGTQVKLLRVLQSHEIVRVGENLPRKVDIRIIAATNRNVRQDVAADSFREDLFYRLAVIELEIPPLRDRPEDIPPLVRHFVEQVSHKLKLPRCRLDPACLDHLVRYSWPGNVRELENILERAAVLCRDHVIRPEDLPHTITTETRRDTPSAPFTGNLASLEQHHIQSVLDSVDGNRRKAAAILGISTVTLWRRLRTGNPTDQSDATRSTDT